VLEFDLAPSFELENAAVRREADRIPETDRGLHPRLGLESPQGRVRVQRPIAPRAACEPVLEEHANDRHHGQAAVRQLRGEFRLPHFRVLHFAQEVRESDAVIPWLRRLCGILHLAERPRPPACCGLPREEARGLDHPSESDDLGPT